MGALAATARAVVRPRRFLRCGGVSLAPCVCAAVVAIACGSGGSRGNSVTAEDSGVNTNGSSGGAGSDDDSGLAGSADSSGAVTGKPDGQVGPDAAGHYYASPTGTGSACSSTTPCSITQAQTAVRSAAGSASTDLAVELADGVYALATPLVFTAADSAANGHTVSWQAAANAHPVLSGGKPITGWTVSDAVKNIWKAP